MKKYIISIIVAGIICAITDLLLDKKTATGKIAKILTGILMCVTILSPLTNISFKYITNYFDSLSVQADNYVEDGMTSAQISICGIIKSQTEAYILDKANLMGLRIAVEVELNDSNNSVPSNVTIQGDISPYAKEILSSYIESNLAIPKENQKWL